MSLRWPHGAGQGWALTRSSVDSDESCPGINPRVCPTGVASGGHSGHLGRGRNMKGLLRSWPFSGGLGARLSPDKRDERIKNPCIPEQVPFVLWGHRGRLIELS
jgi:hypothetical protein